MARRAIHFLAVVFTQPESWEHGKANHQTRHTTLLEHPSLFGCHHTDSSLEGSGSCLRGMQICLVIANTHQLSPILQGQYAIPCVEHGRPTGPLHLQGSLLLARFSIIRQSVPTAANEESSPLKSIVAVVSHVGEVLETLTNQNLAGAHLNRCSLWSCLLRRCGKTVTKTQLPFLLLELHQNRCVHSKYLCPYFCCSMQKNPVLWNYLYIFNQATSCLTWPFSVARCKGGSVFSWAQFQTLGTGI